MHMTQNNQEPRQSDGEKQSLDSDKESRSSNSQLVIYDPSEKFEWREVIRGELLCSDLVASRSLLVGVFDIQTWLNGLCGMGIVISLFSFSYFL